MCYGSLQIQSLKTLLGPVEFGRRFGYLETESLERTSYPLSPIYFIRQLPGAELPELLEGQYGLVPPWVKDDKGGLSYGKHCYNARSETVFEKPSFRDPIVRRRAVIPVSGYLEVADLGPEPGRHFRVRREHGKPIFLAGLWDYSERYERYSCSILTGPPQAWIKDTHSRSPIFLSEEQIPAWLDPALKDKASISAFLTVYEGDDLKMQYFEPAKRHAKPVPLNGI